MKRVIVIFTLLILLLAIPADTALAGPVFDRIIKKGEVVNEDLTVVDGSLTVEEGATVNGEVVVFGGHADLAGTINGSVSVFGGSADLSGVVDGDVVIIGGALDINSAAEIDGDLVIFGGNLDVASDVEVDGDCVLIGGSMDGDGQNAIDCETVSAGPGFSVPAFVDPPTRPDRPEINVEYRGPGFFARIGEAAGRSLLLGLIALAIAAIAPAHLRQVRETVVQKPAASGTVGLLTAIAGPSLLVLLLVVSAILTLVCIGLLGFPVVMILGIALAAAGLLGWTAMGTILGERLAEMLKLENRTLPVVAALGTTSLTLAISLLSLLPFWLGGWFWGLAGIVISFIGLGSVALTKYGTRPYPLGAMAAANGPKVNAVLETLPEEEAGKGVE